MSFFCPVGLFPHEIKFNVYLVSSPISVLILMLIPTGPLTGQTVAQQNDGILTWSDLTTGSLNGTTTTTCNATGSDQTCNTLVISNLGFTLDPTATIHGIEAYIMRKAIGSFGGDVLDLYSINFPRSRL